MAWFREFGWTRIQIVSPPEDGWAGCSVPGPTAVERSGALGSRTWRRPLRSITRYVRRDRASAERP
eukprot:13865410-Alexandrium_andersonii.AAC.1